MQQHSGLILLSVGTNSARIACEDAFEEPERATNDAELEAFVMAACQWIRIFGNSVYQDVLDGGKNSRPTAKQWRKWRDELQSAASSKAGKRYAGLGEKAKTLAGNAVEEMRAIERKMGASSTFIGPSIARWCCVSY